MAGFYFILSRRCRISLDTAINLYSAVLKPCYRFFGLTGMKNRTLLILLFCFFTSEAASVQAQSFTAAVQQPAGSVILPTAETVLEDIIQARSQPLYTADDVLLYLPAPANIAESISVTGERIEVIILGPRLSKNRDYEILPIGVMEFEEGDSVNQRVLAIPANPSLQTIKSPSLEQLQLNYPGVIEILKTWFENAYNDQQLQFLGVKDERKAFELFESF